MAADIGLALRMAVCHSWPVFVVEGVVADLGKAALLTLLATVDPEWLEEMAGE